MFVELVKQRKQLIKMLVLTSATMERTLSMIIFCVHSMFLKLKNKKKTVVVNAVVCPCNNVTELCTRNKAFVYKKCLANR